MSRILISTEKLTDILNAAAGLSMTPEEIVAVVEKSYPAPKDTSICIGAKKLESIITSSDYTESEVLESISGKTLEAWIDKHQNKEIELSYQPAMFTEMSESELEEDRQLLKAEKEAASKAFSVDLDRLDKKLSKIFEKDEYDILPEGVVFHADGSSDRLTISIEKIEKKFAKFSEEEEKPYKSLAKWLEKKYDEYDFEYDLDNEEDYDDEEDYEYDEDEDEYESDDEDDYEDEEEEDYEQE